MNTCYLDAFSGLSGDMTIGALLDAGADFAALSSALDGLGTGAQFRLEKTRRGAVAASKFHVDATDAKAHRHLHHIIAMIDKAPLPSRVKQDATRVFRRLAEAEAAVHGTTIEKVHFHEVGAVDSICDIVGACFCLHSLGVESLVVSPVNVGSGAVKTQHGLLPVPAPATAALLKDRPVYARGPQLELTTPTGAAIAAALAESFGPMPALTIRAIGYGAGDRDFPEHANVLRAVIGEHSGAAESTTVTVLEANIDDTSPQVLGHAMDVLFTNGALDVTLQPLQMKKNRPGTLVRVIALPETQEALAAILFRETSTLGLRLYSAERRVQPRRIVEVQTSYGAVRIKVSGDGSFAPEYDDCHRLALSAGVPLRQVLADAGFAYLKNSQ